MFLRTASSLRCAAVAAGLLAAVPASAQDTGQTPKQPTANDPSVGLPSQPATMTKNPEAMSPDAARKDGTAPAKPSEGAGAK